MSIEIKKLGCYCIYKLLKELQMIKQFASIITSFLLKENIIGQDDLEIYQFGTERILKNLIVIFLVSIIATAFNVWIATIFMFAGFIILRKIAGGYHAKTLIRCNLLTFSLYAFNMVLIYTVKDSITSQGFALLCFTTILLIFIFAPVDHKNLVFSNKRMIKAKKNSRISVVILVIVSSWLVLKLDEVNIIPLSTMMGAFTASLSILVGNIKRRREKNEETAIYT